MRQTVSFLRNQFKRFGLAAAIYSFWSLLLRRIAGYVAYQRLELAASAAGGQEEFAAKSGFTCRELSVDELETLASDPANDIGPEFVAPQRERRDFCLGIFSGPRLAGYVFLSGRPTRVDSQLVFEFPPGAVYVYKAFTREEWRGRGLLPAVLTEAMRRYKSRPGVERFVTLILSDNFSSLAAFRRLGFRARQRFRLLGVGSGKITIIPCLCRGLLYRIVKT